MRRIVVSEFVSLDGVMEDPGGAEGFVHGGWTFKFPDPEGMRFKLDETLNHDALLLGRVTYDGFAKAWPGRTDEIGFAAKMNGMAKYVVSNTLERADWEHTAIVRGEPFGEIADLKGTRGGDLLVAGSGQFVPDLPARALLDQLRLMVFPIVLGGGKRLFGSSPHPVGLALASSTQLQSGTMILTYHPAN